MTKSGTLSHQMQTVEHRERLANTKPLSDLGRITKPGVHIAREPCA